MQALWFHHRCSVQIQILLSTSKVPRAFVGSHIHLFFSFLCHFLPLRIIFVLALLLNRFWVGLVCSAMQSGEQMLMFLYRLF